MDVKILSGWSVPVIRQVLRWAALVLAPLVLLLGFAMGINWLSQQNWGATSTGYGVEITCWTHGAAIRFHNFDHNLQTIAACYKNGRLVP